MYNILTDNLLQAKSKLQSISEVVFPEDDEEVSVGADLVQGKDS